MNRVVPAPHQPQSEVLLPPVPGRRLQNAPALPPPSLLASACLAAHAPAWAPPPARPRRGLPGKHSLNPDHDPLSHTHRQESALSWAWEPPEVPLIDLGRPRERHRHCPPSSQPGTHPGANPLAAEYTGPGQVQGQQPIQGFYKIPCSQLPLEGRGAPYKGTVPISISSSSPPHLHTPALS